MRTLPTGRLFRKYLVLILALEASGWKGAEGGAVAAV